MNVRAAGSRAAVRRGGRGTRPAVAFFVASLLLGSAAAPEVDAQTPVSFEGGVGAHFQSFHFGDDEATSLSSLSLLAMPVSARVGLGRSVRIEATTTFARGELRRPGAEATTIDGLTDTRIHLSTDLLGERVTLAGVVALPTGADAFTAEEADLAGAMAADLLPFRVSSWGSGGGVGASASAFHHAGAVGMGVSAGYQVPGEFTPIDAGSFQYRPGPSLQVQALIDYTVGTSGRAALQLGWVRFGDDAVEGVNLFRSGDRVQARASYSFATGPTGSGVAYLGYLHRSAGAFLEEPSTRPSQDLVHGGAVFRYPWRGMVAIPSGELRIQRREDGRDQGTLGGVGIGLEVARGTTVLVPQARVRAGSVLMSPGVTSGVLGAEVGLSIRYGVGR